MENFMAVVRALAIAKWLLAHFKKMQVKEVYGTFWRSRGIRSLIVSVAEMTIVDRIESRMEGQTDANPMSTY